WSSDVCSSDLSVTGFITTVSPYGHPRGGIANLCPESGHMRVDDQQNPGGKPGRLFVIVVRIPIPEPDERQQRAGRIILDVLVRRAPVLVDELDQLVVELHRQIGRAHV